MLKKTARHIIVVALILLVVVLWIRNRDSTQKIGTITIGAILPMTGSAANYGELMSRGITMASNFSARTVSRG
jgi:ABC-type branched-subunit amino acid transport system substrate-binding protein